MQVEILIQREDFELQTSLQSLWSYLSSEADKVQRQQIYKVTIEKRNAHGMST